MASYRPYVKHNGQMVEENIDAATLNGQIASELSVAKAQDSSSLGGVASSGYQRKIKSVTYESFNTAVDFINSNLENVISIIITDTVVEYGYKTYRYQARFEECYGSSTYKKLFVGNKEITSSLGNVNTRTFKITYFE